MKKTAFSILVTLFITNGYSQNKLVEDQKAIKSMCGCYEVGFNFAETYLLPRSSLPQIARQLFIHFSASSWAFLLLFASNPLTTDVE